MSLLRVKPAYVKKVAYSIGSQTYGNGIIAYSELNNLRQVYFGYIKINYWTPETKLIFKNSVKWVIGPDKDLDGYCKLGYSIKNAALECNKETGITGTDCNDGNSNANPEGIEVPYNSIDENCDLIDLADTDLDGYCKSGYAIQNRLLQCANEPVNSLVGTDCNDEDILTNPGSTDNTKDCVNEAPILLGQIPDISWNEGETYDLDLSLYFQDPEAQQLTYTIADTSSQTGIIATITGNIVHFTTNQNWYGNDWIIFKATDPDGLFVLSNNGEPIVLTVAHVNHNPILSQIENVNVLAGNLVKITPSATDIDDGDEELLAYTFTSPLNSNGEWQTTINDVGTYTIIVTVTDINGGSDSQEVTINVFRGILINEFVSDPLSNGEEDGNDWVEVYNPSDNAFDLSNCELKDGADNELDLTGVLGNTGNSKLKAFDWSNRLNKDGDIIKLYCYNQLVDSIVYGNWNDGNIDDNLPNPGMGKSLGRENDGLDLWIEFDLPTKNLPNNYDMATPIVELISPENNFLFENTREVNFKIKPTDNSEDLTCQLYLNDVAGEIKQTKNNVETEFSLTNLEDGEYTWNVKCSDTTGNNAFSQNDFHFAISAPDNPRINIIEDRTIKENETLTFEVSGTDPDGDTGLIYSVEDGTLPLGAEFDPILKKFTWTPNYEQSGVYNVKFIVTDSDGLKGSSIVKITVTNVKKPASFSDIPQCTVKNDNIEITIKDPDSGDDFVFGDKIDGKVSVKNKLEEDVDLDLKIYLYEGQEENSVKDTKASLKVGKGRTETKEFSLDIPNDADEGDYYIFVKADDNDICNSKFLRLSQDSSMITFSSSGSPIMPT